MQAQCIQIFNGQGYPSKRGCDTVPELALDTSDQTCGVLGGPRSMLITRISLGLEVDENHGKMRARESLIHPSTSACFQLQTYEGTFHVILARNGLYLDICALIMLNTDINKSHLFLSL